jgi:hypothetical protein
MNIQECLKFIREKSKSDEQFISSTYICNKIFEIKQSYHLIDPNIELNFGTISINFKNDTKTLSFDVDSKGNIIISFFDEGNYASFPFSKEKGEAQINRLIKRFL